MAYEKILVLESNWASDEKSYIADSRSTSRIYGSVETLLSLHETPVFVLQRPFLKSRYSCDVQQFVALPANQRGPNFVILSGHGKHELVQRKSDGKKDHRRIIHAIDGEVNLNKDLGELGRALERTVFILDSCSTGLKIKSFVKATGALGAIGFSEEVSWVDSAAFLLAFLLKCQEDKVFQMQRADRRKPMAVLESMVKGSYKSLASSLGLEYCFQTAN